MDSGEHLGKVSWDRDIPGVQTGDWETPATSKAATWQEVAIWQKTNKNNSQKQPSDVQNLHHGRY